MSSLFGAAPDVLDIILELAAALGNDSNYDTNIQNQIHINSNTIDTYLKTDVDVCLPSLQAEIDRRVLISSVDISSNF